MFENIDPRFHESTKRDRPLSSFLDTPADTVDLQEFEDENDENESELDTPSNTRKNKLMLLSPLMNRKPFRNLTNMMSLLKKKTKELFKHKGPTPTNTNDTNTTNTNTNTNSNDKNTNSNTNSNDNDNNDNNDDDHDTTVSTIEDMDLELSPVPKSRDGPKASGPRANGPRAVRRFHSMYQTNKERDVALKDNSILHESNIKYFQVQNDLIPRIDLDSFFKLINDECTHNFDDVVIIDCRFDYEYEGGHIKNAINIPNKNAMDQFMHNRNPHKKSLIVFHCEFSVFRGPTMASHLRKSDRILNFDNYPNLSYPDILILDGGYKQFYEKFKPSCDPQNYIEMKDINFNKKCDTELHRFKSFSKLNDHSRSSSFTTITSHAENLKILKRQKSLSNCNLKLTRASTFSYSDSDPIGNLFGSTSDLSYPKQAPQEDFQPPIPIFQRSNKSSNSINSLNSSLSELSTFSSNESNDSVSISNSPIMEMNDFFSHTEGSNSSLTLNLTKPPLQSNTSSNTSYSGRNSVTNSAGGSISSIGSINSINSLGAPTAKPRSMSNKTISSDFRFPNNSPTRSSTSINGSTAKNSHNSPYRRPSKSHSMNHHNLMINTGTANGYHSHNNSLGHSSHPSFGLGAHNSMNLVNNSSPIISSPLSNLTNVPTPISTIDTSMSNNQSLLDPINDTPVDFQVPYFKKNRSSSNSNYSIHNFKFGDIDEDEEL